MVLRGLNGAPTRLASGATRSRGAKGLRRALFSPRAAAARACRKPRAGGVFLRDKTLRAQSERCMVMMVDGGCGPEVFLGGKPLRTQVREINGDYRLRCGLEV